MKGTTGMAQPVIKDSFNRTIDYLRISITDKCNLKCVYCMPSQGVGNFRESEIMTDEEIVRLVQIACRSGLRKVRITGGEPLMRRGITSLIAAIKKAGVEDLALTTNGIKLAECAEALKKSGLDRVNISLDTMNAERYKTITSGGDIERVLKSIEEIERIGLLPLKINMVPVIGLNEDEIESFASLTLNKNYHVRFIEFMPAVSKGMWKREKCVGSKEVLSRISSLGKLELMEFRGKGPSRNYRIKGAAGVIGIISPLTDHFCSYCNRLRLTCAGKIRPCLFSKTEIDIRTPMRNGASDEEIERLFLHAVQIKPERHLLNEEDVHDQIQSMSKIGG